MQVTVVCAVAEPVKGFALVVIALVVEVVCAGHAVAVLATVTIVHVMVAIKNNSISL